MSISHFGLVEKFLYMVTIQVSSENPSILHLEALQEACQLLEKEREQWKQECLELLKCEHLNHSRFLAGVSAPTQYGPRIKGLAVYLHHYQEILNEFLLGTVPFMAGRLIPVVTMVGLQLPVMIGGVVVVELIFGLPGVGTLLVKSLNTRDYTIVSGVNLFMAVFVLVTNLIVDISYTWLDLRIRYK